jgi:NAD(P)H dehydrogenase (quinone)
MILITGATGQLGGATIRFLLDKGFPAEKIGALVRDEVKAAELKDKGINPRIGDYNNLESLMQAFTGIDKLLLVSSSDLNDRTNQHINAVKAARSAGVGHIFYTSFQRNMFFYRCR